MKSNTIKRNLIFALLTMLCFLMMSGVQAASSQITSPANGSTLTSTSVVFRWNSVGASEYFLYVGTYQGANNLYGNSQGTGTAATVSGLPSNGSRIYARLYSKFGTAWGYNDYNYIAYKAPLPAKIITPANGVTLSSDTVTFQWENVGASGYSLSVGSSQGGSDLFGVSLSSGVTSKTVSLPRDGRRIYVRLSSLLNNSWQYNDYIYTAYKLAPPPAPTLDTPANGISNVSQSNVYFSWDTYAATNATNYRIVISQDSGFSGFNDNNGNSSCNATCFTIPLTAKSYYKNMDLPGQTYYWKVRANNAGGASGWSNNNQPRMFKTAGVPLACGGSPYMDLPFSGAYSYKVSQGNNGATSHYDHTSEGWDNTYAVDIALPSGTPIKAPVNGTIYNTYGSTGSGCLGGGKVIVLTDTASGNKITFLHLSSISKTSGTVTKGDVIGYSGGSKGASGVCNPNGYAPHLHIHLWNGYKSPDSHTKAFPSNFKLRIKENSVEKCLYGSDLNDSNIYGHYWSSFLN